MVDKELPVWTPAEGAAKICGGREDPQVEYVEKTLAGHLAKGKSLAYYENHDLGHPMLGHVVALTFGTPEAQFEPKDFPDGPPKQLPDGLLRDITGGINWRYQLVAITYSFPVIVEHDVEPAEVT